MAWSAKKWGGHGPPGPPVDGAHAIRIQNLLHVILTTIVKRNPIVTFKVINLNFMLPCQV